MTRAVDRTQSRRWQSLGDCLLICGLSLAAGLPASAGLGFYGDDWYFQETFRACPRQDTWGLFQCVNEHYRYGHFLYQAFQFRMFGTTAYAYHVMNTLVGAAVCAALYILLRSTGFKRSNALAIGLIYATLPHYSTARTWIASSQAMLSVLLLLLAALLLIPAGQARRAWRVVSWTAAAMFGVMSALTYEIVVPLLPFLPLVLYRRLPDRTVKRIAAAVLAGVGAVALAILSTQTRVHFQFRFLHQPLDTAWRALDALVGSVYGAFGLGLPATAVQATWFSRDAHPWIAALVGITVAVQVAGADASESPPSSVLAGVWLHIWSVAAFLLCFSPFLASPVPFVTSGAANRICVAAAMAVAASLVGTCRVLAATAPMKVSSYAFGITVGAVVASGIILMNVNGAHWIRAARRQDQIVERVRQLLPDVARGSTIVLNGFCSYEGPAMVFESDDTGSRLRLAYGDNTLKGDMANARTLLRSNSLVTRIDRATEEYALGPRLMFVDITSGIVEPLTDYMQARAVLQRRWVCADGPPGLGNPLF